MGQNLLENIIISGGNCNIPNFKERLQVELDILKPEGFKVNIREIVNTDYTLGAYKGLQKTFRSQKLKDIDQVLTKD